MFTTAYAAGNEAYPAGTETTSSTADAGLLASLGIHGNQFIAQLINFLLIIIIVWFLILKPLTKKMAERQKLIEESLGNVKKIEENVRKSEQKYQERVDQAKVETNKMMERATGEAEQVAESIKTKSKREIEQLVEAAKRNIVLEKEAMTLELRLQTADLVVEALRKILTEKIDDKKDKVIIEEMLGKLK